MKPAIRCFSCNAAVPDEDGPTHPYMESAPGCWKLYGEVLARMHTAGRAASAVQQLIVDAYAVHHPGKPGRKAIQSVNIHLISLCCQLEQGFGAAQAVGLIGHTVQNVAFKQSLIWLPPPDFTATGNVAEVADANDAKVFVAAAQRWGETVWLAWKAKHGRAILDLAQRAQVLH